MLSKIQMINKGTEEAPTEPTQPTLRVRRSDDLFERGEFENIDKLIQQPKQESGEELYMWSVCPDRFSSGAALEAHMARTGHYSISAHTEQPQTAPNPIEQLAQQVQRIPASFNSQPYRPDQSVPPYGQNAYTLQRINLLDSYPFNILNNLSDNPDVNNYSGPLLKLTPVGQSASPQSSTLPNLPPGIQLQKRPAQQNLENYQPKQRREEMSANKLPSSITLVRPSQQSAPPKKPDNSVADILANRGITMVPSGGKTLPGATNMSRLPLAQGRMWQVNTSVNITPSARSQQQPYAGRGLPTIDLTSDPDHPTPHQAMRLSTQRTQQQAQRMRNRPLKGMINKLPYKCVFCRAQYPTAQRLAVHKQKYHTTSSTILDMAIPEPNSSRGMIVEVIDLTEDVGENYSTPHHPVQTLRQALHKDVTTSESFIKNR